MSSGYAIGTLPRAISGADWLSCRLCRLLDSGDAGGATQEELASAPKRQPKRRRGTWAEAGERYVKVATKQQSTGPPG